MDQFSMKIPLSFVTSRSSLSCADTNFGIKNQLLEPSAAVEIAAEKLAVDSSDPHLLELASVDAGEPVGHLVERLAKAEAPGDADVTRSKWAYLVLEWIYQNRDRYPDVLALVGRVYADFDYLEEVASFVRYMPSKDGDLGSRELTEQRLLENWQAYLARGAARFGGALLEFDERSLRLRLERMSPRCIVAFGLACAERMYSNYEHFEAEQSWGDSTSIRRALDASWAWLRTERLPSDRQVLLTAVERAAPDTEDFESHYTSSALDAAAATCLVLELISGVCVDKALQIGVLATDSVNVYSAILESANDTLMRRELASQRRDLDELASDDGLVASDFEKRHREVARSSLGLSRRAKV